MLFVSPGADSGSIGIYACRAAYAEGVDFGAFIFGGVFYETTGFSQRYHNFFSSNEISYTVSQGSEMGRPSTLLIKASLKDGIYTIHVGGRVYIVASGE